MMKFIDFLLSLSIPISVLVHLLAAPYTKVEESFNIQAAHDVLVYGTPTSDVADKLSSSYDHFTFPGAVPRTFIGAVLLAGVSQPIVAVVGFEHAQVVVRAVLGLFNAFALLFFRAKLAAAFGRPTARWYILLQASQFHVLFYASRTLPNMFAFGLTTLASAYLLPSPDPRAAASRIRLATSLFVFAAVIFRSEVALLLGTNLLYLVVMRFATVRQLVGPFIVSFVAALAMSVPIDSYFWQKPVWPELWGFYYNAVLGSSSNWGVSPWHYYFTSALPRLLLNPVALVLLIPLALRRPATAPAALQLVVPNLAFVAVYSLQPHKEARFIFYVVPPLTAAAALGANAVATRWSSKKSTATITNKIMVVLLALSVPAALLQSAAMLVVSSLNYPGGEALAALRAAVRADDAAVVSVHADVLTCMTGLTLFGSATADGLPTHHVAGRTASVVGKRDGAAAASIAVDKTEDPLRLRDPDFWTRFDYVLAEDPAVVLAGPWRPVAVVDGYAGVEFLRPGGVELPPRSRRDDGPIVGKGAAVAALRDRVRRLTGGWWVGPRMEPRIRILKRVKESERSRGGGNEAAS